MSKQNNTKKSFKKTNSNGKTDRKYQNQMQGDSPRSDPKYDPKPDNFKSISGYQNDPAWYKPNEQLAKDYATLSFFKPAGTAVGWQKEGISGVYNYVPGICVLKTHPTVGLSKSEVSAINVAARQVYTFVRHMNSGSKNYDAPDLMMYLMAADNIYSFHSWMRRLYGCLNLFAYTNRYFPKSLVEAMNCDYDNLKNNMAQFRAYINNFALRASSVAIPNIMSLFKRHYFIYENIWMDSASIKGQMYLMNPTGFYIWDQTTQQTGTSLHYDRFDSLLTTGKLTYENIAAWGDKMLNAFIREEDVGIISGDILKAFGTNSLWRLSDTDAGYVTPVQYNGEILSQIHNASIIGIENDDITQDLSAPSPMIVFNPRLYTYSPYCSGDTLLDAVTDSPSVDDVIEMTRLHVSGQGAPTYDADRWYLTNPTFGSEIIEGLVIHIFNGTKDVSYTVDDYVNYIDDSYLLWLMSSLDWHPLVHIANAGGTTIPEWEYNGYAWDTTNYRAISYNELANLNDMAITGEFAVGKVGTADISK